MRVSRYEISSDDIGRPYRFVSDDLLAPCATEGATFRDSSPARPEFGPPRVDRALAVPAALYAFSIALFLGLALVPIAGQRAAMSDYAPALLLIVAGLAAELARRIVRRRVAEL